jgi:hypothetical protein
MEVQSSRFKVQRGFQTFQSFKPFKTYENSLGDAVLGVSVIPVKTGIQVRRLS